MAKMEKNAACDIILKNEIGVLADNINYLYQSLLLAIYNLEIEKQNVRESEKSKIEFLQAASHELKTPVTALNATLENMILGTGKYKDYDTLQELFRDTPVRFISAKFSVDDPADLETIANRVKESSEIDWQAFTIITNNKEYQQAAAQLEKLQSLVTSIIFVTALVSGVIPALILIMWGRSRIHETGVFLSLGIGKSKIIGQYLVEALMIAVIAFGLSLFTSNAAANQIANGLIESTSNEENSSWPGI